MYQSNALLPPQETLIAIPTDPLFWSANAKKTWQMHFWDPSQWDKMCFECQIIKFQWETKWSKFSHLLSVRAEGADPPPPSTPYGQPDRKMSFFLTTPLSFVWMMFVYDNLWVFDWWTPYKAECVSTLAVSLYHRGQQVNLPSQVYISLWRDNLKKRLILNLLLKMRSRKTPQK